MRVKTSVGLLAALVTVVLGASNSFAATFDVKVAPENDKVYYYCRGMGWVDQGWTTPSAVDDVNYWYGSPSLNWQRAYLSYSLSSFPTVADINSVSFNFNLLGINSPGDAGAANLYYGSNLILNIKNQPLGLVSVDVTKAILSDLALGNTTCSFTFDWVGYGDWGPGSGISFSSGSDSANAAFLRITDTAVTPEPISASLFMIGGGALALLRKRKAKA